MFSPILQSDGPERDFFAILAPFPAWHPLARHPFLHGTLPRHGPPWLGTPSSSAPRIRPSFHYVNKSRGELRIVSFENGTSFLMRIFAVTSNEALESLWASF